MSHHPPSLVKQGKNLPQMEARLRLEHLSHGLLKDIRHFLKTQLEAWNISSSDCDKLLLSATEVFSNLIKHPPTPPTFVEIYLQCTHDTLELSISDNSTPFLDFKNKRQASISKIKNKSLDEDGRGLGLIYMQHKEHNYTPAQNDHDLNQFQINQNYQKVASEKSKHIFIVDDSQTIQDILKRTLEKKYKVKTFSNASEALESFKQEKPDLIISDLHMPVMNGIELRQELSKLADGNTTPFIFISGDKSAAHKTYITQLGIDGFIIKPIDRKKLLQTVERLLLRSSQIHSHIHGTIGQDITRILEPRLPNQLGNWAVDLKTAVAQAGGGDFVMHHETEEGTFIILADVMGHGISAKFFAYAYAGYLRSLFKTIPHNGDPGAFLKSLSKAVSEDSFLEEHIITCLSLFLEPDGLVKIASAGHPAPLLLTQKEAKILDVAGPLPGLSEENYYITLSVQMTPGERLLLFTDGLVENTENFSLLKLTKTAHKNISVKLPSAIENIWQSLPNTSPKKDDTTLILLEYTE